jgi:hypothetical protein
MLVTGVFNDRAAVEAVIERLSETDYTADVAVFQERNSCKQTNSPSWTIRPEWMKEDDRQITLNTHSPTPLWTAALYLMRSTIFPGTCPASIRSCAFAASASG